MPRPRDGDPCALVLIPDDGIGLVTGSVERYDVHGNMPKVPLEVIELIKKNKAYLICTLPIVNCFNVPGLPP
ncbi:unnamed protein product [Linum trigynum]|uniref:Uncharacterized protein n=1 Tax=Linum trigynum TaxID=586398 RepID=A0AAV2ED60_9ROSI